MNAVIPALKNRKSSFQRVWNLETGWKLEVSKINSLGANPVSNWNLDLETWKLACSPLFARVSEQIPDSSLSPTLTGVSGSRQRLRLANPLSRSCPSRCGHLTPHHHTATLRKEFVMAKTRVVRKVDFSSVPEIGTILMKEGQRYELIAHEPHVRADGQTTTLLVWQSHCAETGHPFEIKTGLKIKYINRRCKQHSKPGRTVVQPKRRPYLARSAQRAGRS